jgi:hypothetical protein
MGYLMRAIASPLAILLAVAQPAEAAWSVTATEDQTLDHPSNIATVVDVANLASLSLRCVNGAPFPEIMFPEFLGIGKIGVNFQFDETAAERRLAPISMTGRAVQIWDEDYAAAMKRLSASKRLRVQLFPEGRPAVSLEFDITGASAAIRSMHCK